MAEPRHPVAVATASDAITASIWVDALHRAGIEAGVFERSASAALGGAAMPGFSVFPVLVDREALGTARSVIADLAGASVLEPLPDQEAEQASRRRALLFAAAIVGAVLVAGLIVRLAAG